MESGRLTRAEEDFRRVIALDPKSAAAHVNLGVTYMREKRWDDALVELGKAESLSPNEPGIRLNIGLAYYRKSDFDSAIEPFTAALRELRIRCRQGIFWDSAISSRTNTKKLPILSRLFGIENLAT